MDCRLRSLDGITSFPNLKILRLPGNEVHNVDQCIYLPQLCHLDVRREDCTPGEKIDFHKKPHPLLVQRQKVEGRDVNLGGMTHAQSIEAVDRWAKGCMSTNLDGKQTVA
ncbi:hypothetical protein TNCV_3222551 [Trichonephila clavipes]|nr:hypothetical protein TNCV_3222551 [Trichonephila clavipes]